MPKEPKKSKKKILGGAAKSPKRPTKGGPWTEGGKGKRQQGGNQGSWVPPKNKKNGLKTTGDNSTFHAP